MMKVTLYWFQYRSKSKWWLILNLQFQNPSNFNKKLKFVEVWLMKLVAITVQYGFEGQIPFYYGVFSLFSSTFWEYGSLIKNTNKFFSSYFSNLLTLANTFLSLRGPNNLLTRSSFILYILSILMAMVMTMGKWWPVYDSSIVVGLCQWVFRSPTVTVLWFFKCDCLEC